MLKIVKNLGILGAEYKAKMIQAGIGTDILKRLVEISNVPDAYIRSETEEYDEILTSAVYAFVNIAYTADRDKLYITDILTGVGDIGVLSSILNNLIKLRQYAENKRRFVIVFSDGKPMPVSTVLERIIQDIRSFISTGGSEVIRTAERLSFAGPRTPPPGRTISSLSSEEQGLGTTPFSSSFTEVSKPSNARTYSGLTSKQRRGLNRIGIRRNNFKREVAGIPTWRPAGQTRRLGINRPFLSSSIANQSSSSSSPYPRSPHTPLSGRTASTFGTQYSRTPSPVTPTFTASPIQHLPGRFGYGIQPIGPPHREPSRPATPQRGGKRRTIRRKRNIRHYKNGRSRRNS
jgi:hypothetical protein